MASTVSDRSRTVRLARLTGGFYVAFILASVLADSLGRIGISDTEDVYQRVVDDIGLFRLGLTFAFVSAFLFLLAAWGLYVLLRPVSQVLALLFLLLNAVGVAIQCASMLPLIHVMLMADGPHALQGYSAEQLQAMSYQSIDVYGTGFVTAQLFFGAWLFPLGYLVYTSGILPKFLGVLLLLDGVGVWIWFLQALLLPDNTAIIYPGIAVSFVAEVGLALWLLLKGVRVDERSPAVWD